MNTERYVSAFERQMNELRRAIKQAAAITKDDVTVVKTGNHLAATAQDEAVSRVEDRGEMVANLMLAYRHLEDASMRIGKVIQAHNGGASVYDRESTVGA